MTDMTHKPITIAGMGKSGMSVANYLSSAGVSYNCCDDGDASYNNCMDVIGEQGYVIKSPGVPPGSLPVSVSGRAINDVELFFRMCKRPVIMVTGTNGKSTVVAMLEHMFRACGVDAIACGNNGVPVLHAYSERHDLYILELSSYQLENITSFHGVSSVVLNVGVDHVDRYLNMDEYAAVKQKVYTCSEVSVFPVNEQGDVEYREGISGYMAESSAGSVTYSLVSNEIFRNGKFYCKTSGMGFQGRHNHINVCASLALMDTFGFDSHGLVGSLNLFHGLPHRMELICKDERGYAWINDSKSTNVHSLLAALSSQTESVCLIMGGRGKGEDYSNALKQYSQIIGKLITYGEDGGLIAGQASSIADCVVVGTVPEAVAEAIGYKGDVLFSPACASFDQYSDFVERGNDFKQQVLSVVSC